MVCCFFFIDCTPHPHFEILLSLCILAHQCFKLSLIWSIKTFILIIPILERNWNSSAIICYLFKQCKLLCAITKVGCIRISTRLVLMNSKTSNKWLNLFLFIIWGHLCEIVIKNQITLCLIRILLHMNLRLQIMSSDKEDPIKYSHCKSGARLGHVASIRMLHRYCFTQNSRDTQTMYFRVKLCPVVLWTVKRHWHWCFQ